MSRNYHGIFEICGGGGAFLETKNNALCVNFYMQKKNALTVTFLHTKSLTLCVSFLYSKKNALFVTFFIHNFSYPIL